MDDGWRIYTRKTKKLQKNSQLFGPKNNKIVGNKNRTTYLQATC
jgi:hypothetical protein